MTLQEIRYLVTLADHGHFGRAAEACHISQPTLSTQIKKLEAELGVRLFERSSKSVHVTAIGEEIVERGRKILTDVEAILTIGRRASGPLIGKFSLGVISTLGPYLLPWLIPTLRETYPDLHLAMREDMTANLLEELYAHRLDAALVALPIDDERIETLPLFDEPFWFAEAASRGTAKAKVMSVEELRRARLLLLTEGHCLRDQALAVCGLQPGQSQSGQVDGDFRATSLETIRQMVAIDVGATLLPALACASPNDALSLRPLEDDIGRRIALVWRRGYAKTRDIQVFAEIIRGNLPPGVLPIQGDLEE